jgi:membrane fusion protein (multidrug efflux system)
VGTLDGFVNAVIKAQVSGYLQEKAYHEGSQVRKGQLLFVIDPRPMQAALAQAQGQLAQAQGQLGQATSQKAQSEAVVQQAKSQILMAQAALEQARGQVEQMQATEKQAEANQVKTQLDVDKYRPLREKKAVTQQDLDNAVQVNRVAVAQVHAAQAQVSTARGAIAAATAQMATAHAAVAAALAQVGTSSSAIVTARAQVQSADAAVRTAQLNLTFTRIESPVDGVAGLAQAQVGDLVGPTTAALTTVSTVNPIKVVFSLPEQEYLESLRRHPSMRSNLEASRQLSFELVLADGSVYRHPGRFYAADRNVDPATGNLTVTATFANPEGVLRPGEYARIRSVKYVEPHALMVPQRAVTEMQDRNQVAVVGADDKVTLRSVRLGDRVGSQWIVLDGLKAGDTVVVEGTSKVRDGATVKPTPWTKGS